MRGVKSARARRPLCAIACAFAFTSLPAAAQTFPQKPIRIIVPYPPGGPSDMQARLIGIELTKAWGQTSVIDNRGGGSGIIGTELAARADADGHTLIMMSGTNAVQPGIYPKLPYDLMRDFAHITSITYGPGIMVVSPALPVRSASELIAYAKARPGKVSFGSAGNGAPSHLVGRAAEIDDADRRRAYSL